MGHKSVAVIERWLFNRGPNIGHYITSDLKYIGGCNSEVAALQSDHYTEVSLYHQCIVLV